MFKINLLKYLISPITKEKLVFLKEKNILKEISGNIKYKIIDGVPVMFTDNIENIRNQTEHHRQQNSYFKYVDHYLKDAEAFDYYRKITGAAAHNRRRTKEIILLETKKENKLVLDVGCGRAWVAEYFIKSETSIVISFDIAIINTVKALKKHPSENHFAVTGDAFNPPFKPETFDYIIASEIIEHVADPSEFIKQLFSLLRKNGKLIITTPYKEKLKFSTCIHCNKKTPHSAHLHSFDEQILSSLYSDSDICNTKYERYANKLIDHFRMYKILNVFPYKIWKIVDSFFNLIYNKPNRIKFVYHKVK